MALLIPLVIAGALFLLFRQGIREGFSIGGIGPIGRVMLILMALCFAVFGVGLALGWNR